MRQNWRGCGPLEIPTHIAYGTESCAHCKHLTNNCQGKILAMKRLKPLTKVSYVVAFTFARRKNDPIIPY